MPDMARSHELAGSLRSHDRSRVVGGTYRRVTPAGAPRAGRDPTRSKRPNSLAIATSGSIGSPPSNHSSSPESVQYSTSIGPTSMRS